MANKAWYETFSSGDCIKTVASYNDMIDYIKHSACTDFTIYSTCTTTGQAFRFTQDGAISYIYGGDTTGDDLSIYANDSDSYPKITLLGGDDIKYYTSADKKHYFYEGAADFLSLYEDGTNDVISGETAGNDLKIVGNAGVHNYFQAGQEFKLFDGATEAMRATYAANITTVEGGAVTGDDLTIKSNSIDALPYIGLDGGDGNVRINGAQLSAHFDLALLGDGVLCLKEGATPTADATYGKIYCKDDNKLYFQDGAGAEHELAFAP